MAQLLRTIALLIIGIAFISPMRIHAKNNIDQRTKVYLYNSVKIAAGFVCLVPGTIAIQQRERLFGTIIIASGFLSIADGIYRIDKQRTKDKNQGIFKKIKQLFS